MILFTGNGTSGSWQVRGVQLGAELGARVKPRATLEDCRRADIIVAVKRQRPELIAAIKASRKPWVLDIVDAYPQPACTQWSREEAIGWVRSLIKRLKPIGVIWPNQRMREDCDTGIPGVVIPHHYRPGIAINPVRETVQTVAYEGSPAYLGEWLEPITQCCLERGWEFLVNPPSLSDADIVLACRGGYHNGYVQRHWKSNVKLANAHGSGTPFIGPKECGYLETSTGMEQWADSPSDLDDCFDRLTEWHYRGQIQKAFLANRYSLEQAARDMREFLSGF